MIIISWNCRGTGSKKFFRNLQSLWGDHKYDILILMETRVSSTRIACIACIGVLIVWKPRALAMAFGFFGKKLMSQWRTSLLITKWSLFLFILILMYSRFYQRCMLPPSKKYDGSFGIIYVNLVNHDIGPVAYFS